LGHRLLFLGAAPQVQHFDPPSAGDAGLDPTHLALHLLVARFSHSWNISPYSYLDLIKSDI
jgi:hypothetical protein